LQSKPGELLARMKAVGVNPLETYMRCGVYNTKFLGGVYGKILLTP
jgi:NADPH:quinone reductase-like Zn-dependent oxidoreductase